MTDERDVRIREATPAEAPAVVDVLDAAFLQNDPDRVRASAERGDVLVAVPGGAETEGPDRSFLGALVLDGDEIEAVAVRRRQRGRGVGSALVAAAAEKRERLTAGFRAEVRPFYERLGFAIDPAEEDGRFRGHLDGVSDSE